MLFDSPIAVALNHLLDAEPWARKRLALFPGDTVELRLPLFASLRFTIEPGGRVSAALPGSEPSVLLSLRAEALADLVSGDPEPRGLEVSGNARLATEVLMLLRHLRWDIEEDLSRILGDVAAHRLVGAGRDFLSWQEDAARRLAGALADYASEEKRWLVQRSDLRAFCARLAALGVRLEELENRVRRLG
jgi:ubiquinone biosynthesis accessory factor UbiJ